LLIKKVEPKAVDPKNRKTIWINCCIRVEKQGYFAPINAEVDKGVAIGASSGKLCGWQICKEMLDYSTSGHPGHLTLKSKIERKWQQEFRKKLLMPA